MREDTPQWLAAALDEALLEAGSTETPDRRSAFIQRLIAAWNMEGRTLHNCRYLAFTFERLDELEGATTEPENLRLAAAYRGALEEPGWEEAEALRGPTTFPPPVGVADFIALGLAPTTAKRIESLAEQLARHAPEDDDLGARLLVDADLAILATSPQQYRDFKTRLRQEVAHMSERDFLTARSSVLTQLLGRRQIFSTPVASQWEDAARENVEAELAGLEAKLELLNAAAPGTVSGQTPEQMPPSFPPSGALPPSFPPEAARRFNPESAKPHSRVLRISKSQKLARLDADAAGTSGPVSTAQAQQNQEDPSDETTKDEDSSAEKPDSRFVSDSEVYVSDTSTLESVADLIERPGRSPRNPA